MTLGERIKECRQEANMSQEKVAELVGVSRQAVTKWESNRSAPNTENLFKLAEIFGTTVDMLLETDSDGGETLAEQIYRLHKSDKERKAAEKKMMMRKNIAAGFLTVIGYLAIYLAGRFIWCDLSENSFIGWLVLENPTGDSSYLYGWLLSSRLFWVAMAISAIPAFFGKRRFSLATFIAFVLGLLSGILFGPNPAGAVHGHGDYGWAIWGVVFFLSVIIGVLLEKFTGKT